MWFQQDDATCHIAHETIQLLHETFPVRVRSRFSDHNWLPRLYDLTPSNFFLWSYLKSKVYVHKPTTTRKLKERFKAESTTLSHISAKWQWKTSNKSICAILAVKDIFPVCYSIHT